MAAKKNKTPAGNSKVPAKKSKQPATSGKARKTGKATEVPAQPKKLSALDAAAKVLAEANGPMNCQEMIDAMAAKGYWTTPGGKTPASTLYSSLLREITVKGKESRFRKVARGKFAPAARA